MRNLLGMLTLLPLGLPALAPAPAQSASSVVLLASRMAGCPVGLEARHAQDGGLISVSPSTRHPEQTYRILFTPPGGKAISEAKITLQGLAGGQVLPAGASSKADATESFHVSPAMGAKHLFHSIVSTEKLTGVQWVELNELTYSDGTKWHESDTATCRVAPNGFMLVSGN